MYEIWHKQTISTPENLMFVYYNYVLAKLP